MSQRNFEMIETNGVRLRCVVEGEGPLVILLHGFPQCWYLWRHQIDPIVDAGFRVAVPDQRGYGGSEAPPNINDYDIRTLTADVNGLAATLGESQYVVVGHDWGCLVAWNTALMYEDTCRAVMGLSVPTWRMGPNTVNPEGMDAQFWYIRYFQQPGVAEAELEADLRSALYKFHFSVAADAPANAFMSQLSHPATSGVLDVLPEPPATMPAWLSAEDLDYYVKQYEKSGFRGPINWYRNIPTNNADTPELEGKKFSQPAAFAAGVDDPVLLFDPDWQQKFPKGFNDLRFITLIEGAGHWLQTEKPEETTAAILKFLTQL